MKTTILLIAVLLFSGCATYQAETYDREAFRGYKMAYLTEVTNDNFNVTPMVIGELDKMGLSVTTNAPPAVPAASDVVVKIQCTNRWDLAKFLSGLNIQFLDARSGKIVAIGYYRSAKLHPAQLAVSGAFDRIRASLQAEAKDEPR